ncbi:MAG: hypothetical protein IJP71_03825 [Lachnospiraceae bacterium]|nr:hypothetical protein [Lachnospiraceae bacterium]
MNFIVNNWFLIVALVAAFGVTIYAVVRFLELPTAAQIAKVKEWLVYACMEAEKELGGKTGKLKLRMVYDMFLSKFNWLAKVVSFEQFSKLVDESLEEFKHLLESNKAVKNIVAGK